MKALLFFYVLILQSVFALDTGTGADGACTEATLVSGTRTYNCATLTIGAGGNTAFQGQAGSVLVIKVQGAVTINGAFNVSGANGGTSSAKGSTTNG